MANRKFELLADQSIEWMGRKLYRIRALISFGSVTAGEVGGYAEKEANVSAEGNAWVYGVPADTWVHARNGKLVAA